MPAKGKVSLKWQALFSIISPINIWAYYRIQKLRRYVLYVAIPSIVISLVITPMIYGFDEFYDINSQYVLTGDDYTIMIISNVVFTVSFALWSIFLIFRWSKEWNKKFQDSEESV